MAFAIMRFEKHSITKVGGLAGSLAHTFRSRYTPNADPKRIADNETLVGVSDPHQVVEAIQSRYPKKPKKNNVGCYEFMVTYSPEADIDPAAYFDRAISWLEKEFGAENVVSVVRHNDETTPHIAAYVVPIDPDTGRLNARRWTGGKALCSALQTRFWEHTGRDYGLERGVKGSQAKHMTIAHWYGAHQSLDEREKALKAREKELEQREKELNADEKELQADFLELSERERKLDARANEMADSYLQEQKELAHQREALQNSMLRIEKAEIRVAKGETRLNARESSLDQRQASLDGRDIDIEQRRSELTERESDLKAREGKFTSLVKTYIKKEEQFEQQKAAWIAEHRPALPPLVRHLQHLETLGTVASAEYLEAQNDDRLYDLFSPQEGLTKEGRALLDRYAGLQERAEKFEQTFTPSTDAPGL